MSCTQHTPEVDCVKCIIPGISGNNIVGLYQDSSGLLHGFLYNGTTYTTIDDSNELPGGIEAVTGVDGNNLVGFYESATGFHGFEAIPAVPEPSTWMLGLLGLGALAGLRLRRTL